MTTAAETARLVSERKQSAEETIRAAIERVAPAQQQFNAFLDTLEDDALERARSIDQRTAAGESLPLAGVPIAVKDNICIDRGLTTAGSRMLAGYRSPFTATAVERLEAAGAIPIVKTTMDEFGMGSSCEYCAGNGPTRNPADPDRTPGGSSGGSSACVAAGVTPVALGSDTGGSIRQPAAFTGTVGFKPTYGRISRFGLIAFASSLDQIGPMTTTVEDAALTYQVMAGADPRDATTTTRSTTDPLPNLNTPPTNLRIGIVKQITGERAHPAVARAIDTARDTLQSAGAEIVEINLPALPLAIDAYYVIAPAEASSNLARYDGVRYGHRSSNATDLESLYVNSRTEGFGPEVRRRIMIGTHVLSAGFSDAFYLTALRARRVIKEQFDAALTPVETTEPGRVHALLTPATPGPAFRLGEKLSDPLAMYLEDIYTVGINLAGLPAITLPGGTAAPDEIEGGAPGPLPIGVQLIGSAFDDAGLLRVARMLESALAAPGPNGAP